MRRDSLSLQMEALLAEAYATVKQMLVRNRPALDRCAAMTGSASWPPCLRWPGMATRLSRTVCRPWQRQQALARCYCCCCWWLRAGLGPHRVLSPLLSPALNFPHSHHSATCAPCSLMAALLERSTLTGEEVRALVNQHAAGEDLQRRDAEQGAFL